MRLVCNRSLPVKTKLRIFKTIFPAVLTCGLDAFALTGKNLQRDDFYFRFLRRIILWMEEILHRFYNVDSLQLSTPFFLTLALKTSRNQFVPMTEILHRLRRLSMLKKGVQGCIVKS